MRLPIRTAEERRAWAEQVALLFAREAGWWGVLRRWTYSPAGLPYEQMVVYGRAALMAQLSARDSAREWRDRAERVGAAAGRGDRS
ncbi:hypothetical protein BJF78_27340 [Pseudonocardia sp. CNS-139]|nr:hypothetical protein BJF78_27340 [Pseudonocardia sp. CNS-139]